MDLAGDAHRACGGPPFVPTRMRGLPGPDPAGIQVDEVRGRVVADTAAAHREGDVAKFPGGKTRQPNVDRLPYHMEAVLGDAGRVAVQKGVGGRRAITGDHVERIVSARP